MRFACLLVCMHISKQCSLGEEFFVRKGEVSFFFQMCVFCQSVIFKKSTSLYNCISFKIVDLIHQTDMHEFWTFLLSLQAVLEPEHVCGTLYPLVL